MWLNVTVYAQSEIYIAIRRLEFVLLGLGQKLDDLMAAIQCVIQGNLPVKLIGPLTLQDILRNVTLQLPDGFELIFGTKTENMHHYYQVAKEVVVAKVHHVKLMISVPLKAAYHLFTLHRIITLPERTFSDKFILYTTDYAFLGLQTGRRDYISLSESDFDKCSKGDVVVCPVNTAVYSIQSLTCEISLYFQAVSHYRLCKRNLLPHPQFPNLQRHGTLWTYYFPTRQQVAISCPGAADYSPRAVSLDGIGLLHNASSCRISTMSRYFPNYV